MDSQTTLIADDHAVVRGGIKHLLAEQYPFMKFIECENGKSVLEQIKKSPCDLVIMDISMPDSNGLDVLRDLKEKKPAVPVIMLTVFKEEQYALRAFQLGASGYLQKAAANDQLIAAAKAVLGGGKYVTPSMADRLLTSISSGTSPTPIDLLTEREHSVMLMIAEGKSLKEISCQLNGSPKTITTYRTRVLQKLNLDSNAGIVQFALKNGLIE